MGLSLIRAYRLEDLARYSLLAGRCPIFPGLSDLNRLAAIFSSHLPSDFGFEIGHSLSPDIL
jgi:hypothetical protein